MILTPDLYTTVYAPGTPINILSQAAALLENAAVHMMTQRLLITHSCTVQFFYSNEIEVQLLNTRRMII